MAMVAPASAQTAGRKPATVAEAAKFLDLRKFPRVEGAEEPRQSHVASLSYVAEAEVEPAFEFHRKELASRKWKEAPQAYVTKDYCSATYTREGYTLSLSVTPGTTSGQVLVSLTQHGNVNLETLPLPRGARLLFGGPASRMSVTEAAPEPTADALRDLLEKQGWVPYGEAGDVRYYKQNAVLLSARVLTAPAQDNKTVIDYSTVLMSADLPAPPQATRVQYSDTQLSFDTSVALEEVDQFYRETLGKQGWKATTDNRVKVNVNEELIFLNKPAEMLLLQLQTYEGQTRGLLRFHTLEELQQLRELAEKEVEKAKTAAEAGDPAEDEVIVEVSIPGIASEVEEGKHKIEFQVPAGKAQGVATGWYKEFTAAGWKKIEVSLDDMVGTVILDKDDRQLTIVYVDTGLTAAEISISSFDCRLARAKPKPATGDGNKK